MQCFWHQNVLLLAHEAEFGMACGANTLKTRWQWDFRILYLFTGDIFDFVFLSDFVTNTQKKWIWDAVAILEPCCGNKSTISSSQYSKKQKTALLSLLRLTHVVMTLCDEFPDSLFGLGVWSRSVIVHLLFQSILSFVPVKQSAQDGGETVLSQRAHGAYQLRESDVQHS